MKRVWRQLRAIGIVLLGLCGCAFSNKDPMDGLEMLDGPGMVYVDRDHWSDYAKALPFSEESDAQWAVVFLGYGEEGMARREQCIDRLFPSLTADARAAIRHFEFPGDAYYFVIPRYCDVYYIMPTDETLYKQAVREGEPFSIRCNGSVQNPNVKVAFYARGGYEVSPQTDSTGRLVCEYFVWDLTEYQ